MTIWKERIQRSTRNCNFYEPWGGWQELLPLLSTRSWSVLSSILLPTCFNNLFCRRLLFRHMSILGSLQVYFRYALTSRFKPVSIRWCCHLERTKNDNGARCWKLGFHLTFKHTLRSYRAIKDNFLGRDFQSDFVLSLITIYTLWETLERLYPLQLLTC